MANKKLDRRKLKAKAERPKPDRPKSKSEKKAVSPEKKPGKEKVKEIAKVKGKLKEKPGGKAETPEKPKVKIKKPRAKKLPPRMRAVWHIYDGMMKKVAQFEYNQKSAAEKSLAQFLEKKPNYFLQLAKELLPVQVETPPAS